jgi:hypothetical protein
MNFEWRRLEGAFRCPVCGLPGYFGEDSFDELGGVIATGICPCCFFEPGFDDNPAASGTPEPTVLGSILACRRGWIEDGMPWRRGTRDERIATGVYDERRTSDDAPKDWSPTKQLETLFRLAPDLR